MTSSGSGEGDADEDGEVEEEIDGLEALDEKPENPSSPVILMFRLGITHTQIQF